MTSPQQEKFAVALRVPSREPPPGQLKHAQPRNEYWGFVTDPPRLGELQGKRIDLYLHQQALDTSTPAGRAMFQMLGVFAEFERSMIQERVKSGLARARAKGVTLGRRKVHPKVEGRIRDLASSGMGKLKIGKTLGVGTSVVQRVLAV
ncbi:MAG: recombinase family protein [Planctomycetaceae bacterium]|nr:recombinase family protein [Planctomycetaceae bacterium]